MVGKRTTWFDGFLYFNGTPAWNPTSGEVVGTLSISAPSGATCNDFNASQTPLGSSSTYYNYNTTNITGLGSEFGETDLTGWHMPGGWTRVGYYLNDLCDGTSGTRDYIAFGLVCGATINSGNIIGWDDALIFVVQ